MSKLSLCFFAIRENSGCTSVAISVANYFINGGLSVAVAEPLSSKNPKFSMLDAKEDMDGTKVLNSIRYYPVSDRTDFDEDIVIWDVGSIGITSHPVIPKTDLTYLCTDIDPDSLEHILDMMTESGLQTDILLMSVTKQELTNARSMFADIHTHLINIDEPKNGRCPSSLVNYIDNHINMRPDLTFSPPSANSADWGSMEDVVFLDKPFSGKEKRIAPKQKQGEFHLFRRKSKNRDTGMPEEANADFKPVNSEDIEVVFSGIEVYDGEPKIEKPFAERPDIQVQARSDPEEDADDKTGNDVDFSLPPPPPVRKADVILDVPDKIPNSEEDDPLHRQKELNRQKQEEIRLKREELELREREQKLLEDENRRKAAEKRASERAAKKAERKDKRTEKEGQNKVLAAGVIHLGNGLEKLFHGSSNTNAFIYGHISIFVAGIRHGCGTSYASGSLASYLSQTYGRPVTLCHKVGTNTPQTASGTVIDEYTADGNFDTAYGKNNIVIFDRGIFGEYTRTEMTELQRADLKLMVTSGEEADLMRLSKFVHKAGQKATDWIYVFNLPSSQKMQHDIAELMDGYDYMFLQMHDYAALDGKTKKTWANAVNKYRKRVR